MTTASLFDLTRAQFDDRLEAHPNYRTQQIWEGLYTRFASVEEMSNLPKSLRSELATALPLALTESQHTITDDGDTEKWLWQLRDGSQVETVLMLYPDRATVCVSSQAGCAMACSFCATGQAGYDRNLTVGEILEQVIRSARAAAPRRVSNVVFMGMGEPLANTDVVWEAIERLHGDIGLSARSITLSTVGIIPGIRKVTEKDLPVTLAVSLHAANDELRNSLVPINKRYPLADLADALIAYRSAKGRRVSFEWAMIADVNDRDSDARELARIAAAVRAHVNLIPLNPTPGYAVQGTHPRRIQQFADLLTDLGVNATIRRTRGAEIDAACGQLAFRSKQEPGNPSQPVTLR